jgi:hypothetical protein
MICSLVSGEIPDLTKYYVDNDEMASFICSQKMETSVCTEDVDCTDNAQQIFWRENEECFLCTMGLNGQLLFLFFFHTGDVASVMI